MIDVAFDARLTSHMSAGMRTYTSELRARLPRVARDLRFAFFGSGDNFDVAEQVAMPMWIARHRPRLVHFPSPLVPLVRPRPYVMTIHDLIELRSPEYGKRKVVPYYRYVVAPAARAARAVICDDGRTTQDLEHFLGVGSQRVRVVPLGVDETFLEAAAAPLEPGRYLLYVGNRRKHKDLETLLEAWSTLPAGLALDLHLTGPDDSELAAYRARFALSDARLVALGDLSDRALIAAYRGAFAYVHPSRYEGFGLPMLEAAVLGVPLVVSDASVPEVLRAGAFVFPAGDARALRTLLEQLVADPARALAAATALQPQARELTWDRCAQATAAVYRAVLRP